MNYKLQNKKSKNKEIEEIETLIEAYGFAAANEISEENLLKCHKIFSTALLTETKRGSYRNDKAGVFDKNGLLYPAAGRNLF